MKEHDEQNQLMTGISDENTQSSVVKMKTGKREEKRDIKSE